MSTRPLALIYGEDVADEAYAAVDAGPHGIRMPDPVMAAVILGQGGVPLADLGTALEATARCRDVTGWEVLHAAEFVATAAAIGAISGPSLLLVPNIARVAVKNR